MYRGHRPGDLFEATLETRAEARAIGRGDIEVIERSTPSVRPGSYQLPKARHATTYKALSAFRGHQAGDEFEADLDPALERRALERGQIKKVPRRRRRRRTMAKRIALKDHIAVDAVDLSQFARSCRVQLRARARRRVGFTATGANEYLAGQTEQSVTIEFFGSYGATEVAPDAVPDPRRPRGRRVRVAARPDRRVSATNPQLEGNVQLLTYNPSATRGEAETWEATFIAADAAGLTYHTT